MASNGTSQSQSQGFVCLAVVLIVLALMCFAIASFSCTTFEYRGDENPLSGEAINFAFGVWMRHGADDTCEPYATGSVDAWLKVGRIVGITGCQVGFATAVFLFVSRYLHYSKDVIVAVGYFGLIVASLLAIGLLTGLQSDLCTTPSGDRACRVNLSSTGVLIVVSVVLYGLAGVVLYCLDRAETEIRQESAPLPTHLHNRNQTTSRPPREFNQDDAEVPVASDTEIVVETIQEADGSRLKRTTKRSVQSDGSKVVEETTEILSRSPVPSFDIGPVEQMAWSSMVVETVSKQDGSVTKTTTHTFDEPATNSRLVQRTVEISERKLRPLVDMSQQSLASLGRNGKSVEMDTLRQPDGSHIKTTTTTTRMRSNLYLVERVIAISERGVRTSVGDASVPDVPDDTIEPPTSVTSPERNDQSDDESLNHSVEESKTGSEHKQAIPSKTKSSLDDQLESPGGGAEESKEAPDEHGDNRV